MAMNAVFLSIELSPLSETRQSGYHCQVIEGLSMRLNAVASQVIAGEPMVDIGTDHAQLPVALVVCGRVPRAIAMDVADGPLSGARRASAPYSDRISVRKSNGFEALLVGEVSSVSIAGMGGGTMVQLLLSGRSVWSTTSRLILQPQGMEAEVRMVMLAAGSHCIDEMLVEERGQIYMVMSWESGAAAEKWSAGDLRWGRLIRTRPDPLYSALLARQYANVEQGYQRMVAQSLEDHDDALALLEEMKLLRSEQSQVG
jgi:tRNA (adenine22-N1)-methyltransferase